MTAAEILRAAADLVERPGAWTQGASALDASGRLVDFNSDAATCFCALGALWHAAGSAVSLPVDSAETALRGIIGRNVGDWNDASDRTATEVAQVMRRAAATLDAGGGA